MSRPSLHFIKQTNKQKTKQSKNLPCVIFYSQLQVKCSSSGHRLYPVHVSVTLHIARHYSMLYHINLINYITYYILYMLHTSPVCVFLASIDYAFYLYSLHVEGL